MLNKCLNLIFNSNIKGNTFQQLLPNVDICQIQNTISIFLELHSCLGEHLFSATPFTTDGHAVRLLQALFCPNVWKDWFPTWSSVHVAYAAVSISSLSLLCKCGNLLLKICCHMALSVIFWLGGLLIAFIIIWLISSWAQPHSKNCRKLNGNANGEILNKQAGRLHCCLSQYEICEEKIIHELKLKKVVSVIAWCSVQKPSTNHG